MRLVSVSVTGRGRELADRLPFPHVHGGAAAAVRERWGEVDGFVLFLATGAAVRIVAPLLSDKRTDPAVVCVDEAGRFAVALCGGHVGGANDLARRVAALLGAEPVVTTATDAVGETPLDTLPGLVAAGDVAGVTTVLLDGQPPLVENPLEWPLPPALAALSARESSTGPTRVVVTDRALPAAAGTVTLHPPSLVVGVGASSGAPATDVAAVVDDALEEAGLARASVAEVATLDRKATEPGIVALGLPLRTFSAEVLANVPVPSPSTVVDGAVGTPSVAEAAALLAAGPGAELVVPKRRNHPTDGPATATAAVARRRRPRGHLALVGLGPGDAVHRTAAAETAVRRAEVVIGYGPYVDQCADLTAAGAEVVRSPIGDEVARAKQALAEAEAGRRVALVCSGDAGVYAMASITLELTGEVGLAAGNGLGEAAGLGEEVGADGPDIEVVPGVTAAIAAAAALGAPLGHDHLVLSLSDLLTPWEAIERRVRAAAEADLVVALYNPRSRGRAWQLDAARRILLEHRPPDTPVGVATDVARPSQRVVVTTLGDLDCEQVGMTTCVIIGSSTTVVVAGRMVTPRGYLHLQDGEPRT